MKRHAMCTYAHMTMRTYTGCGASFESVLCIYISSDERELCQTKEGHYRNEWLHTGVSPVEHMIRERVRAPT